MQNYFNYFMTTFKKLLLLLLDLLLLLFKSSLSKLLPLNLLVKLLYKLNLL